MTTALPSRVGMGVRFILLSCLVAPATAMLRGFGLVFGVEPPQGSEAGYTELHITGAGFGYVQEVRVGGNPCLIHEPSVKNGELTCFTPAGTGSAEVQVIFVTGHVAIWRDGEFQYEDDVTPYISWASQAAPVLGNISFRGDLKKVLEGDQQFFQELNFEKRNATEIMHVYLGSGLELMGAMGGRDEWRCDLIETATMYEGVCEVSGGTPGGFYNFTYILEDLDGGMGFGGSDWIYEGMRRSLYGIDYHVEVVPGLYSISEHRGGRLGGTRVTLNTDGMDTAKGLLDMSRYSITFDGVPCVVEDVYNLESRDYLTCVTGPIANRPQNWTTSAFQKPLGYWGSQWNYWTGIKFSPKHLMFVNRFPRAFDIMDNLTLVAPLGSCGNNGDNWHQFYSVDLLEECAEQCFRHGLCEYIWWRPDERFCAMCHDFGDYNITIEQRGTSRRRRSDWALETGGGVYQLHYTGLQMLEDHPGGKDVAIWELVSKDKICDGNPDYNDRSFAWPGRRRRYSRMNGQSIQECAEMCAMFRGNMDGGWCRYFMYEHHRNLDYPDGCIFWQPEKTLGERETGHPECTEAELEERGEDWTGPQYASYKLVRPVPHSPQPTGIYPGGRGVHYRVWNACPENHAFPEGCWHWQYPFAALYAGANPEYQAQTPMFEGVRLDYLRGPFGEEPSHYYEPYDIGLVDPILAKYNNLQAASESHGVVIETLGFFVAPFTADYSFMVWGNHFEDMWVSASRDPSDITQVAEVVTSQCRGTWNRRRTLPLVQCNPFGVPVRGGNIASQHRGKLMRYMLGYRNRNSGGISTSTVETLSMEAEERRFFVRRAMHRGEDTGNPVNRRRRGYASGSAVRIHNPDLSGLSAEKRQALKDSWSWPEIIRWERTREKDGGQWRFGVKMMGTTTYSRWMPWNANEWWIFDSWNMMVFPDGSTGRADAFYTWGENENCQLPCNGDSIGRTYYTMIIWEPRGDIANLVIEYDQMRSNWYSMTLSDGSLDDLFIYPIPGSMLEVPATEPQVKVTSVEIPARTAYEIEDTIEENETNTTNETVWMAPGTANYVASDSAAACTPTSSTTAYQFYRLTITALRNAGLQHMMLAELLFWDTDGNMVDMSSASVSTTYAIGTGTVADLTDGDEGTGIKGDSSTATTEVIFIINLGSAVEVDMWSYSPFFEEGGNINAEDDRFPAMWTLEGAASDSWPGTMVHDQSMDPAPIVQYYRRSTYGAFPNQNGRASCGTDVSGCEFGQTFQGIIQYDRGLMGVPQVYPSWTECQRRCCYRDGCVSAVFQVSTGLCTLYDVPLTIGFVQDSNYRVSSVLSKGDSMDGYAMAWPGTEHGLPLAAYHSHTPITFCKDACDNTQYCAAFQYHEQYGCYLHSRCAMDGNPLVWQDQNQYSTYYKLEPETCVEADDLPIAQVMMYMVAETAAGQNETDHPDEVPYVSGVYASGSESVAWNMEGFLQDYVSAEADSRRLAQRGRRLTAVTDSTSTSSSTMTTQSSPTTDSSPTSTSTMTTESSPSSTSTMTTQSSPTTDSSPTSSSTSTMTTQTSPTSSSTSTSSPLGFASNYSQYPIRLVGWEGNATAEEGVLMPNEEVQGRLEVYINGEWGTVCTDLFGAVDAGVACAQLGYSEAYILPLGPPYVFTVGEDVPIWLDDVSCDGSEEFLTDCGNRGFGVSNCFHTEDIGLICSNSAINFQITTATTTPGTTTTTTTWTVTTQTPRMGFLMNKFSGKCIRYNDGASEAAANVALELGDCKFHRCDNEMEWQLTDEGFIEHVGSGLCIGISGSLQAPDYTLVLKECDETTGTFNHHSRRWKFYDTEQTEKVGLFGSETVPAGFIRNQHSAKCLEVDGPNNNDAIRWNDCEFEEKDPGQVWDFVVMTDIEDRRKEGYLLNIRNDMCLDVEGSTSDGDVQVGMPVEARSCDYVAFPMDENHTDQLWELTDDMHLKNTLSGLCAVPEYGENDAYVYLGDCADSKEWNFSHWGYLEYNESGFCLFANDGDGSLARLKPCVFNVSCTANPSHNIQWTFNKKDIDLEYKCAERCASQNSQAWNMQLSWSRRRSGVRCGCLDSVDALYTKPLSKVGFLSDWMVPMGPPSTMESSLKEMFMPNMTVGMSDTPDCTINSTETGFCYLPEDQQPAVTAIKVNGVAATAVRDMCAGDMLLLEGENFDDVDSSEVEITIGGIACVVYTFTATEMSCMVPSTPHTRLNLKVRLGWKGWVDFSQVITGATTLKAQVAVFICDGLLQVDSMTPVSGSVLGGTRVKFTGSGFQQVSGLNNVTVASSMTAGIEGNCTVMRATLTELECLMPDLGLMEGIWDPTTYEEDFLVTVNGIDATQGGTTLTFKYTLLGTPFVRRVAPPSLSFAVSEEVNIIGGGFGPIRRHITVKFGDRECNVLDVNPAGNRIKCWLPSAAMALPAVCDAPSPEHGYRNLYNTDCTVVPELIVSPTVLVASKGYGRQLPGSELDTRFEIHGVWPSYGSTEGGAYVRVSGIGFSSPEVTSNLLIAALGTTGDYVSWTPTEVIFITRPITLNVDFVDMMVNLIVADHKCGGTKRDPVKATCHYTAFGVEYTPTVLSVSEPDFTDWSDQSTWLTRTIEVEIPDDPEYRAYLTGLYFPDEADWVWTGNFVQVFYGSAECMVNDTLVTYAWQGAVGDSPFVATIVCTLPDLEAQTGTIRVRLLPYGYAAFADGVSNTFTIPLVVNGVYPPTISGGGEIIYIEGRGWAEEPRRHYVRVGNGEYWGACEPLDVNASYLTCRTPPNKLVYGGHGQTRDIVVQLWDEEVARHPLLAFGDSSSQCLRNRNDYGTDGNSDCFSEEECAMRCLMRDGCLSFDYSERKRECHLSAQSYQTCTSSSCKETTETDCRYYEKITSGVPETIVATGATMSVNYRTDNTIEIVTMFALPADRTSTSCDTDTSSICCTGSNCDSPGSGYCDSDDDCDGNLVCAAFSCLWDFGVDTDTTGESLRSRSPSSCCALRGTGDGYAMSFVDSDYWKKGDQIVVRLDPPGSDESFLTKTSVSVKFDEVELDCGFERYPFNNAADIECTLGDIPGGLVHYPQVDVAGYGRAASDVVEWIQLPLEVTAVEAVELSGSGSDPVAGSSLGGGWELKVTGTGFAPAPEEDKPTYVEVALCGHKCEITNSSYTEILCTVPNVTTQSVAEGTDAANFLPKATVISREASMRETITPACFHGRGDAIYEVGSPECAMVFNGDPEITGGIEQGDCFIGLDFGEEAAARIEAVRFHPQYSQADIGNYEGLKIQVGTLAASPSCDEFTYGWRGTAYRGCSEVTLEGNPCSSWSTMDSDLVAQFPELSGHSKCRNPTPQSNTATWCYQPDGSKADCSPQVPDITWTTIHEQAGVPVMLWNTVEFDNPSTARFVRLSAANAGGCLFTEIEVIGQVIATGDSGACEVAVRNVRAAAGERGQADLNRPLWRGSGGHQREGFMEVTSGWVSSSSLTVTYDQASTPLVLSLDPRNGTQQGGTEVTIEIEGFGVTWDGTSGYSPVQVAFNTYDCPVQWINATHMMCITTPRNRGLFPPSVVVTINGTGLAVIKDGVRWRYLEMWSSVDTWTGKELPKEGDSVWIDKGKSLALDTVTPILRLVQVIGELVFDDNQDVELHATYIWVKGGTMEIGTEDMPFMHNALVQLHGNKYVEIRLPIIGAKVLAVSNEFFTLQESGDGSFADGDVGTLDIHGAPHIRAWTRLGATANVGDTQIVLREPVDWAVGSEIVLAATYNDGKHIKGEGLHGAPPTHFEDERAFIKEIKGDRRTIILEEPLHYTHRSIGFQRPADAEHSDYIDYSAEVGLLTRNVKIQGDEENSERDSWGGHTMVAFGAVYRISNAEFYRMGQTGELSRYPIHFHISGSWGAQCYAYNNSIHHSFQRAVAIHSTNYVEVKHNIGLEIIGHMFFVETGMEKYNILEGNLGMGAIPLFSGMLESDQEPAAFWTAAPNNVWRNNIAVTGSDGWYFQLSKKPISGSIDLFSNTVCPIHDHLGEFTSNRCHHTTGSCVRIYLEYKPTVDPCDSTSGEFPAYMINTTCWGTGAFCFSGKKSTGIYNWHMTSVAAGAPDVWYGMIDKQNSVRGGKWETDFMGIPHVKEGVFVGMFPEDYAGDTRRKWKGASIEMPQNEQFIVRDSWWYNFRQTPVFMDCSMCWSDSMWRLGGYTYRFSGLHFENSSKRIFVQKKGIYWDQDGTLLGGKDYYATWADYHNRGHPACETLQALANYTPDPTMATPGVFHSSGGTDETETQTIFHVQQGTSPLHARRDYSFIICSKPIRKLGLHWPEPAEVYGRQLNITSTLTGLTHSYEYEFLELTGWSFPVVADSQIKLRINLTGLDLQLGTMIWGFNDLFLDKSARAAKENKVVDPEYINIIIESWSEWWQYKFFSATYDTLAVRHGTAHREAVWGGNRRPDYLPWLEYPATAALENPSTLPTGTHGMLNATHWSLIWRYPDNTGNAAPVESHEPYAGEFDARKCPDEGCTIGLPPLNQNWTEYKYWSEEFSINIESGTGQSLLSLLTNGGSNVCAAGSDPIPDAQDCSDAAEAINHTWMGSVDEADSPGGCFRYINGTNKGEVYYNTNVGSSHKDKRIICSLPVPQLTIPAEDWIIFDMDMKVTLTNMTIFGKLSFDDAADRMLQVEHLVVWGLLEIGTRAHPFGAMTGSIATILFQGSVTDTESYVYIEEEVLHNKLIAVPGRVETYGAPIPDPWLRLNASIWPGATSACVYFSGNFSWTMGTEVAFSPTEASKDYFSDVEVRNLTSEPVWDDTWECYAIEWEEGLTKGRYAGDIEISNGNTVSLRAIVARVDRTVVFDSVTIDGGNYYGGHMEIFDITTTNPARVGSIKLFYTRMSNWGKGGLSAAVKIGYRSEFIGANIPANQIVGCSFTDSLEYAIHAQSSNTPLIIKNNVMVKVRDSGIFIEQGSLQARIAGNAIIGVRISELHPVMTNELTGSVRIPNYAGIRADEVPVSMINNVVAGSDDLGLYHIGDKCSDPRVLNNEVFAAVMAVHILTLKGGGDCMTVNRYTIWKATHIGMMLGDVGVKNVQISETLIADSHLGLMPYFTVGGSYRRLFLTKMTFIGLSEASTWQGCSAYNALPMCRSQSATDMYTQECNSLFSRVDIRQVGFVVPFNTGNKKTCHTWSDYAQCRQFSLVFPQKTCHFPWEYHDHFDRGVGWTTFKDTVFAYWKTDPCGSGQKGRAISMGITGPEVSFPSTFTNTTWYDSDTQAKVEASSQGLNNAFSGRRGPCKHNGGGCMGLDQFLIQDSDGTFLELTGDNAYGSVVPITPRTQWVWTPQLCTTRFKGVDMDALICQENVTVELLEMRNLDRGAKDIKWGPLALTPSGNAPWVYPEYTEDHGFTRGVISSVGPFYGSCPCGWDFSFYHILVKPMVTYYAEAVSLPENFILRYLSPDPDHSIVLQFFYPDSRGVNVFVGSESSTRLELRLGRQPVLSDLHGAHSVDAQALRLYVVVRGSVEGFTARRDLTIRRAPTVKLKINVEISIPEFSGGGDDNINAEGISTSFQTNMAILLGIPPNRMKTVADVGSRRLTSGGTTVTAVSVETEISGSSQGLGDTSAGLNAQAADLSNINDAITSTDDSDLTAAMQVQGEVVVTDKEQEAPSTLDDDIQTDSVTDESAVQTGADDSVDLDAVLTAANEAADSEDEEPGCSAAAFTTVEVGGTTSQLSPSADMVSGTSETIACSSVDSGYDGNITLSCAFGILSADDECTAAGCSTAISVELGDQTNPVTPASEVISGLYEETDCSAANADYTGTLILNCLEGTLTADTSGCLAPCFTTDETNLTLDGTTETFSPSSNMLNGASETVTCGSINSNYEGTISVGCFFGELTPDLSGCQPLDCEAGSTVSIELGGTTSNVALTATMASGTTGSVGCSAANSGYSQNILLSCLLGTVTYSTSDCRMDCLTSSTVSITLGTDTNTASPTVDLPHGDTEALLFCENISTSYEGFFSITCEDGALTADTSSCVAASCDPSTVSVTAESFTGSVTTDETVESGGTTDAQCEDVNSALAGLVTLSCFAGTLSANTTGCSISPCATDDFGTGTVGGVSGLVFPLEEIAVGETGVGSCSDANAEYSGNISLSCVNGVVTVTDVSDCKLTCTTARSNVTINVGGIDYVTGPLERLDSGETSNEDCADTAAGFSGTITMSCLEGVITVDSFDCEADPCDTSTILEVTLGGETGQTTPVLAISHGDYGLAECNEANPMYTGTLNMSCSAGTLVLVDDSGCVRSCNTSDPMIATLEGFNYTVYPDLLLLHEDSDNITCPEGFNGTLELLCEDGVMTMTTNRCDPFDCPANLSGFITLGGEEMNITTTEETPHLTAWTVDCGEVNGNYTGTINVQCNAERVRIDDSECGAPCIAGSQETVTLGTESLVVSTDTQMLSEDSFDTQCSEGNALFTGTFTTVCDRDGILQADNSTCDQGCPSGTTGGLNVTNGSFDVATTADLLHGVSATYDCSVALSSSYSGSVQVQCSQGEVSVVTEDCVLECTAGVQVMIGGETLLVTPTSAITSGDTETQTCASVKTGYSGSITLSCNDGTTSFTDTCTADPCITTDQATFMLDGVSTTISPSEQMDSGTNGTFNCSSANALYSGEVVLSCLAGVVSVESQMCELICQAGDTVSTMVANTSVDATLVSDIDGGAAGSVSCSATLTGYSGLIEVLCTDGVLSVTSIGCDGATCSASESISATLGGVAGTTYPDADVSSGEVGTADCNALNPLYTGSFEIECDAAVVTVPANALDACKLTCDTSLSVSVTIGGNEETVNPTAALEHGEIEFVGCSAYAEGYSGLIALKCNDGVLELDAYSCVQDVCIGFDGLQADNQEEWTVSCSDIHADFGADTINFVCDNGDVKNNASDNCVATGCLSEGDAVSLDCSVLGSAYTGTIAFVCGSGETKLDVSDCALGCPMWMSQLVQTTNGFYTANLTGALDNGTQEVQNCSTGVDSRYSGTFTLSCTDGSLSVADTCMSSCLSSATTSLQLTGVGTVSVSPTAEFHHGATEDMLCSSVDSRFTGSLTLNCSDGTVAVKEEACTPLGCPSGTSLALTLGGLSGSVATTGALAHDGTEDVSCSDANSIYRGSIRLTCEFGGLVADTTLCAVTTMSSSTSTSTTTESSTSTSMSTGTSESSSTSTSTATSTSGSSTTSTATSLSSTSSTSPTSSTTSVSTRTSQSSVSTLSTGSTSSTSLTTVTTASSSTTVSTPLTFTSTTSTSSSTTVSTTTTSTSSSSTSTSSSSSASSRTTESTATTTTVSTQSSVTTASTGTSVISTVTTTTSTSVSTTLTSTSSTPPSRFTLTSSTSTSSSNTMSTTTTSTETTATSGSSSRSTASTVSTTSTSVSTESTQSTTSTTGPPGCVAGQTVFATLGGTVYTLTLGADLEDGMTTISTCNSVDSAFTNFITLTCTSGALSADTSSCVESTTETVITSGLEMRLSAATGTTQAQMNQALQSEASQSALIATLAETLGIDATRITLVSVSATAARRLAEAASRMQERRLTATSWNVALEYEVLTDSTVNDTDSLTTLMSEIDQSGTSTASTFSSAFVTNMQEAADATSNTTSDVLTSIVSEVEANGLTVSVVTQPTVVTREITTTTQAPAAVSGGTSSDDDDTTTVVVALVVVLIVVLIASGAGLYVVLRKTQGRPQRPSPDQQEPLPNAAGDARIHVMWGGDDLQANGANLDDDGAAFSVNPSREQTAYSSV